MKKLVIYTTLGTILIVSGIFVTSRVNAQELNFGNETVITRMAEKLGLESEEIVEVVDDLRADMQAERQAERAEAVTQAMDEGKLTDRQAQILDAMEDLEITGRPDDWDEWHQYSAEEREQLREARREARQSQIKDALYNEQGLRVTQEEMDELHEVMLEEGIGMFGRRGEKGLQMGGGMGRHMYQ